MARETLFLDLGLQPVPQQAKFSHPSLISQLRSHINNEKQKKELYRCGCIGRRGKDIQGSSLVPL